MATTTNITLYAPSASGSGRSVTDYALTYKSVDGVPLASIIAPTAPSGYTAGVLHQMNPGTLLVFQATGTKSDNKTESTWIGFRVVESVNNYEDQIALNSKLSGYNTLFVGQVRGFFEIPAIYPEDGYIEFTNAVTLNDATKYNLGCSLQKVSDNYVHNCYTLDDQNTLTVALANVYQGKETTKYTSFTVNLQNYRLGYASANDENHQSFSGIWINRV